ncbi:MAG TPA: hypothetical protein VE966_02905 [Gemmatimonadales bacterium]|nr:hypothetical protein [Gemmatimonadales bacterium]
MLAVLRRRLEMAVRVRDFLRAHRADGIQGGEAAALARLEELLTRAQVLAAQQRAGVLARRGSTEQRAVVRRALQSQLLTYLSAVGRVAAGDNPELGAHFRLPATRATNQAFLTLGRGMLKKATEQKELLVGRGMSEQLLDDLAAALTQFEQTLEATRAARREHVGASADLESVVAEICLQVRLLDGVVRYRFGRNAELMGAWASARNVEGPFRSKAGPVAGALTPAVVKAAA